MTSKRKDKHSTEFGLWLREQPEIDSSLGYIATNIDYMWRNYKTNQWMLIEEKRHNSSIKRWQKELFAILDWCGKKHPKYCGFHVLQFENTSPEDGNVFLDGKEISKEQLVAFLKFQSIQEALQGDRQ